MRSLLLRTTLSAAILLILLLFYSRQAKTQPGPQSDWIQHYNLPVEEFNIGYSIKTTLQTSEGFMIAGTRNQHWTYSGPVNEDFMAMKTDANGNEMWERDYGGVGVEKLSCIVATSDGGFLLAGTSDSPAGGSKSAPGRGKIDFWVIKITRNGTKIWDRTFGGSDDDVLSKVVLTSDGGFLLAGSSKSGISGDKTVPSRSPGKSDYWVVKININGNKVWDKAYGGANVDETRALVNLVDGFLLIGRSNSPISGEKTVASATYDSWVLKINGLGLKVWDKTFVTSGNEDPVEALTASDGGIVIGENLVSPGTKIALRKISYSGVQQWYKAYNPEYDKPIVLLSMAATSSGFTFLYRTNLYSEGNCYEPNLYHFTKFNWNGFYLYQQQISKVVTGSEDVAFSGAVSYTKSGELLVNLEQCGYGWLFHSLEKFKPDPVNSPPSISFYLKESELDRALVLEAAPSFMDNVTKVQFYGDDALLYEDDDFPFTYHWSKESYGAHKVQAKVFTSAGEVIATNVVPTNRFVSGGFEVEDYFYDFVNMTKVKRVDAATLSNGSGILLRNAGDEVLLDAQNIIPGRYVIKVRLRSGYYNSTSSNPVSYWPDGYSIRLDYSEQPLIFTGDPSSISAKDPSFGGSYWGTMVSSPVDIGEWTDINITTTKPWAVVDYVDFVPVNRIEAEAKYVIKEDVGLNKIIPVKSANFSYASSVKLSDKGDKIGISFSSNRGRYLLRVRVRRGVFNANYYHLSYYWPDGYSFSLDGTSVSLEEYDGFPRENIAYGGSFWGMMFKEVELISGNHELVIGANISAAGVDFIEVIPIEPATIASTVQEAESVHPNPFHNHLHIQLPAVQDKTAKVTLSDSYGFIHFEEEKQVNEDKSIELDFSSKHLKSQLYFLKIKTPRYQKVLKVVKE